jgi:phosphatidylinositol dimannoside acyltransferase
VGAASSRHTKFRTLRETVLLPALAAALPWTWGFGLLRKFAASDDLYRELTDTACNGAMMVAPISDIREWKQRYRLIRLVDHCDMFLVRTRSRRWFRKHVDVDGAWPKSGPFIAMTFHWGAGLWALDHLRSLGLSARFLSARFDKMQFLGDRVAYGYARCRNRTVESAGGAPVIYTGGATQAIRLALAEGHVVVALYDIPASQTHSTLLTKVCDRLVELPAGLANLAVASGVPIVPFAMGLDYQSGRRQLKIEESFHPASAQDFADRLAESLTRLIREDTAAWHSSGYAPEFFAADTAASVVALNGTGSA